jgi:DNA-binding transcriptional LysR family regulator
MSFTFRQLEIFVEAAVDGNFRKTADRIGISQPAISKHIKALEKSLDRVLFERSRGSSARLSASGVALLASADELLNKRRRFEPEKAEEPHLHLNVVVGTYLLDALIRPIIPELYRLFPGVTPEFLAVSDIKEIGMRLKSGAADLAIYTGRAPDRLDSSVEILSVIHCSLYAEPGLAEIVRSDPTRLADMPFIFPPVQHSASAWVAEALRRAGVVPGNVAARVQFGNVLADMVAEGRGIGLLFDEHARRQLGEKVRRLPLEIEPALRVMVRGPKAYQPHAADCVHFLRRLLASG